MSNSALATILVSLSVTAVAGYIIYDTQQKKKIPVVPPVTTDQLPQGFVPGVSALPDNYSPSYNLNYLLPDFMNVFGNNPLILY